MRQYERAGVVIEQCEQCRGIFLDRGELERLVDAEQSYYRGPSGPPPPSYGYQQPAYGHSNHGSYGYGHHGHRRHKGHRRNKSFFDDLFG
jgi:Zn-finger nucleic acid-binding protein